MLQTIYCCGSQIRETQIPVHFAGLGHSASEGLGFLPDRATLPLRDSDFWESYQIKPVGLSEMRNLCRSVTLGANQSMFVRSSLKTSETAAHPEPDRAATTSLLLIFHVYKSIEPSCIV